VDLERVVKEVEDHLMPGLKLDVIERALYHHFFRHTRLLGRETGLFAVPPVANAVGVSESAARERIRSMHQKGCIRIEDRNKNGHLIRIVLPEEIPGLVPDGAQRPAVDIKSLDFFTGRKYVGALVARENGRCFYCLREIDANTCVLDHVAPRMQRLDNSYRNIVAACHECNAAKQAHEPAEFLRSRYRQGLLSQAELQERLGALEQLQAGGLVPDV
jgi:5-methylcytosine-specific restriction endonuclease McrA